MTIARYSANLNKFISKRLEIFFHNETQKR